MADMGKTVAVFGSGQTKAGEPMYEASVDVGDLLAERNVVVVTGAYGGVMEAAAKGAIGHGGETLGWTLGTKGPMTNGYLDSTVNCEAAGEAICTPIAHVEFGIRLCGLMSADGFVLVSGGGVGTILEFVTFLQFATKLWPQDVTVKRMAVIQTAEWLSTECVVLRQLCDAGLVLPAVSRLIRFVKTPAQAVTWVLDNE